jgi:tRNA(Ile)-lysidine synthase
MIEGATGVLVAVSGGPDSVALLDMLFRLKTSAVDDSDHEGSKPSVYAQPKSIPNLHVAHLDHMLRGKDSTQDAEFVREYANRLGLGITVSAVNVRELATTRLRGIEETARDLRYEFLRKVALDTGCDRIAVGHTMNDQAETFLMRLIRGTGLRGLAAMRPCSLAPGGQDASGDLRCVDETAPQLIRPLLCITREEVLEYCEQRGLEYRTDETNSSLEFTRTLVRNQILPALAEINPRIVESISRATENIAADEDVLNDLALSLLSRARQGDSSTGDQEKASYSVTSILEQPAGMRRRIIAEALRVTSRNVLSNTAVEFTSAHVSALESLLKQSSCGKRVVLPGGLEIWREYDSLVLKPPGPGLEAPYHLEISSPLGEAEAGGFAISLQRGAGISLFNSIIEENRSDREFGDRDWMRVALDDQKLPEHLIVRPRLRGERAHVVGRRRTIKLKNLMIDHRIPSSRRATWPIVTTPDGEYIWSPGLPPSVEFAARADSRGFAVMRASAI